MNTNRLAQLGISVLAVSLFGLTSTAQANGVTTPSPLKIGAKLPDCMLAGIDGAPADLHSTLKGKNTVLVFLSGGSPEQEKANLAELQTFRQRLDHRGYQIVAISLETPAELNQAVTRDHLSYKLFSASTAETQARLSATFACANLPSSASSYVYFLNTQGQVTYARTNDSLKSNVNGDEILKKIDEKLWAAGDPWIEAGTEDADRSHK